MRSGSDVGDSQEVTALFEALCRVERQAAPRGATKAPTGSGERGAAAPARSPSDRAHAGAEQGPRAALGLLLRELGVATDSADDDEFPDFEREMTREPISVAGPELAPEVADVPVEGRDAIVRGLLRTLGAYHALLDRYNREFDEVFAKRAEGRAESDDDTLERLRDVQRVLVKYPIAGQAAFLALVREGRAFAETEEGRAWKRRLRGSPALAKARTLFEGLANGVVGEEGGALPSAYVDALVRALDRDVERVLAGVAGIER